MIGNKLDVEVKSYIRAIRECGGVTITIASATAIVRKEDRNLNKDLGKVTPLPFEFCEEERKFCS